MGYPDSQRPPQLSPLPMNLCSGIPGDIFGIDRAAVLSGRNTPARTGENIARTINISFDMNRLLSSLYVNEYIRQTAISTCRHNRTLPTYGKNLSEGSVLYAIGSYLFTAPICSSSSVDRCRCGNSTACDRLNIDRRLTRPR